MKKIGTRHIYLGLKNSCKENPICIRRQTGFMSLSETVRHQLACYSEGEISSMSILYIPRMEASFDKAYSDSAKAYTPVIFASVSAFLGGSYTAGKYAYDTYEDNTKFDIIRGKFGVSTKKLNVQFEKLTDLERALLEEQESSEKVRKLLGALKEDMMKETALVQLEVKK
ncbi:hypothetical protein Bca4012_021263 [Brassica carinata]